MENKKVEEHVKNAVYVTVGATSILFDKAKKIIEECSQVGKEKCEKEAKKNEDLAKKFEEALKTCVNVNVTKEISLDDFLAKMEDLGEEAIEKIKDKLAEISKKQENEEK